MKIKFNIKKNYAKKTKMQKNILHVYNNDQNQAVTKHV